MKKIKLLIASVLFCALGYAGYTTYERMTMTEVEEFMLTNIEALTIEEPGGGGGSATIMKDCYHEFDRYVVGANLYHVCGSRIDSHTYGCGQIVDNNPKAYTVAKCIKEIN